MQKRISMVLKIAMLLLLMGCGRTSSATALDSKQVDNQVTKQ